MALAKLKESWTVEEYLGLEKTSPVKHEYVDGQVYAMAGASSNYNRIAGNLFNLFSGILSEGAEGRCEVFISDLKLKVSADVYYYPDLVVTCEVVPGNADICEHPELVIEVISPTTERIDRHEKMREYENLPGLCEYVVVAQDVIRVEVYRHQQAGEPWEKLSYIQPDQEVIFESVGAKVKLADIYRRVRFSDAPETEES